MLRSIIRFLLGQPEEQPSTPAVEWREFVSSAEFYSLEHPSSWSPETDGNVVNILPPENTGEVTLSAYVGATSWSEQFAHELISRTFATQVATSEMRELKGGNWDGLEQTFRDDANELDWIAIVARRNKVLVLLTANARWTAMPSLGATFRRIIDTLKLGEPPGNGPMSLN